MAGIARRRGPSRAPTGTFALLVALSSSLTPRIADAQSAFDLQLGKWAVGGSDPTVYAADVWHQLWGPFGYSLRGLAAIDSDTAGRSLYGLGPELTLLRGFPAESGLSIYGVGGTGLAAETGGSSDVVALWSAGIGLELRARSWFGAAIEVRRFVEDRRFHGFWDLDEDDRRGWLGSVGFSVRWGEGSRGGGSQPADAPTWHGGEGPATYEPTAAPGVEATGLRRGIVETALEAMGEPYRWGGTSTDRGFDCSGLIWYAYRAHGISLPRVSREQARAGRPISADVSSLQPGDILLFAEGSRTVTHVGLYVGDARFIHSTSSGGVRISALDGRGDEYDRWWFTRWVGARRVLDQ